MTAALSRTCVIKRIYIADQHFSPDLVSCIVFNTLPNQQSSSKRIPKTTILINNLLCKNILDVPLNMQLNILVLMAALATAAPVA